MNGLFSKILTGNASEKEIAVFENWLATSSANQMVFESYKKVWAAALPIREYDLDKAKIKTEIKILEKLRGKKHFLFYWQRIAAILIVPLLVFAVYAALNWNITGSGIVENIKTPHGARTSMILPDGSTVWLNSGSEISFPNKFGKLREVQLTGEIYLEVKKSEKPFIVKTQYGNVKVLGTKFNVCAYSDEPFKTTLAEGSVSIIDPLNSKEVLLKPGTQYTRENGKPIVYNVSSELYTSWKDGKLVFRREPFDLVAKKLERWFNVTINLEGENVKKLWYTGTIEMESFSEVLELLKNTTPIFYSFDSKTRVLTISSKI